MKLYFVAYKNPDIDHLVAGPWIDSAEPISLLEGGYWSLATHTLVSTDLAFVEEPLPEQLQARMEEARAQQA